MNDWKVAATKHTPDIFFNVANQTLELKGECYPENIADFAAILFDWLEHYLTQLAEQTFTVNIELGYFNSSSSKMLLDLFGRLEEEVVERGKSIVVNWIYDPDDESNQEYGEEFKEDLVQLPFHLIAKS